MRTSRSAARNEPLYEISQIKGTSETHPDLSPNDESPASNCGTTRCRRIIEADHREGSYVRRALLDGLRCRPGARATFQVRFHRRLDTHNAASLQRGVQLHRKFGHRSRSQAPSERIPGQPLARSSRFASSVPAAWPVSGRRRTPPSRSTTRWLARKRSARRDPHQVRFLRGWIFRERTSKGANSAGRVRPRCADGGDLPALRKARRRRSCLAIKDPLSGNLDRIQIVKAGWMQGARAREDLRRCLERRPQADAKA